MIYFIESAVVGLIKIGYTGKDDAKARLRELQTGCPVALRVLCSCPGSPQTEKRLHDRFKDSRVNGEWFVPTSELRELIKNLLVVYSDMLPETTSRPSLSGFIDEVFESATRSPVRYRSLPPPAPLDNRNVFNTGDLVFHPQYGSGRVIETEESDRGRKARVSFDRSGERIFLTCKSPLVPDSNPVLQVPN